MIGVTVAPWPTVAGAALLRANDARVCSWFLTGLAAGSAGAGAWGAAGAERREGVRAGARGAAKDGAEIAGAEKTTVGAAWP